MDNKGDRDAPPDIEIGLEPVGARQSSAAEASTGPPRENTPTTRKQSGTEREKNNSVVPHTAQEFLSQIMRAPSGRQLSPYNASGRASESVDEVTKRGMAITFENVSYTISVPDRQQAPNKIAALRARIGRQIPMKDVCLLKNVTGFLRPGEMVALMGPSGAGKTTLLDVLAGRKTVGTVDGDLLFDGRPRSHLFKKRSGYVEQHDTLLGTLTVRDMLYFTARLKMDQDTPNEKRHARVEEVINELGLQSCADTRIGRHMERGISGGQVKRVNIGVELLTDPGALFLDEPTSGLDSATSLDVMRGVRRLADKGRTVVCTIHQPSREIFNLFDRLILLVKGEVVYFGACNKAVEFMHSMGVPVPKESDNVNPAEFIVDVTGGGTRGTVDIPFAERYRESDLRRDNEALTKDLAEKAFVFTKPDDENESSYSTSARYATRALIERHMRSTYRDKVFWRSRVAQRVILAAIIATVWTNLGVDQEGLQNRTSLLFFVATVIGMTATIFVPQLIEDRSLFTRERNDGCYRVISYFLSYVFIEIPPALIGALLFSCLVYFPVGFNSDADRFFFFLLVVGVTSVCAIAYAHFVASISPDETTAQALSPVLFGVFMIFSGFLILRDDIPPYWIWAHYISFFKYAFEALMVNEFSGKTFSCVPGQPCIPTGDAQLERLGFEDVDKWVNVVVLLAITLGFRAGTYFSLKHIRHEKR